MPTEKTVQLTEEARKVLTDLNVPDWMLETIAGTMKRENRFTLNQIMKEHLSGEGPFPPEEHRLGVRTSRLRGAAWASDPEITGTQVKSAIGDNVEYAAIHEFGGRIVRQPRSGSVRLRTNFAGELLHQPGGRGAVFAKPSHKRVKEVQYQAKGYEINMPERAPFRTGIGERMEAVASAIGEDLIEAWRDRAS